MNIHILLFFFLLPPTSSSTDTCLDAVCQNSNQVIRFPFRIQRQQPKSCGYPGFDLTCSEEEGQTVLKLPYSDGEFSIRGIDYTTQEFWVNDPKNCLPKRILSLNLSGSPFSAVYYQDFTFFNCSLEYLKHLYNPIACLSDSNHTVFATSSRTAIVLLSAVCNLVSRVTVPVQFPYYDQILSSDLSDDLRLSWNSPPCGRCESRGGRCGFKSNSTSEIACSYFPPQGISKGACYAISIGIGVPALLCFVGMWCYICRRRRAPETIADFSSLLGPQQQPTTVSGLDGPTIESYPKIVVGESHGLPKPDDHTCPICLSEYKPNETLRTIPPCDHCFHSDCIDAWLPLNASCPLCRTSPGKVLPINVPALTRPLLCCIY